MRIQFMLPPSGSDDDELLAWGNNSSGSFTIEKAYELISLRNHLPTDKLQSSLRKWDGSWKIKSFLWLVSHRCLLTNYKRFQHKITENSFSASYPHSYETILHGLRDCKYAKAVWQKILLTSLRGANSLPMIGPSDVGKLIYFNNPSFWCNLLALLQLEK